MSAKRVDSNQRLIVGAVRDVGTSVQHLHTQGQGCPDAIFGTSGLTLVGKFNPEQVRRLLHEAGIDVVIHDGANLLVEIKDGSKPPSARHLTVYESQWHQAWNGQVAVVNDVDEALRVLGAL